VLSLEMLFKSIGEWRVLLPLTLVVVVFFASDAPCFWLGAVLTGAALLAAIFVFPAVLAIQGWTGKAGQALSPAHWVRMAGLLGGDYLRIVAIATLLVSTCVVALYLPTPVMLQIAVLCYAWLALIAVTGGTIYRRRAEIEDATEFLDKRKLVESPEEVARRRENVVDSIYASWRSGAQEDAWKALQRHVADSEDPLAELRLLYRRIIAWERPQFGLRVARELLSRLLEQDREGEALILARELLALDAGFRPGADEELVRLVAIAHANTDRATAEALQRNMPK
jgi:hypothetical protein